MTDLELYESLRERLPREEAEAALEKMGMDLSQITKDPRALGAAIGAATMFGVQALSNMKGKDGLSTEQKFHHRRADMIAHEMKLKEEAGEPMTYRDRIRKITAPAYSALSDVAADHPMRSSVAMGIKGALAGAYLGKMFKGAQMMGAPPMAGAPAGGAAPRAPMAAAPAAAAPRPMAAPAAPAMGPKAKLAMVDAWARQLARRDVELTKEAFAGNLLAGQAMKGIMRSRWGGAGVGAALGLGKYMMSDDPNKSFVGSVGGGAMLGGMAHMGAKAGLRAAATNKGQVGHFVRDSNRMARQAAGGKPVADIKPTQFTPKPKAQTAPAGAASPASPAPAAPGAAGGAANPAALPAGGSPTPAAAPPPPVQGPPTSSVTTGDISSSWSKGMDPATADAIRRNASLKQQDAIRAAQRSPLDQARSGSAPAPSTSLQLPASPGMPKKAAAYLREIRKQAASTGIWGPLK